jgi:hypothetical protein
MAVGLVVGVLSVASPELGIATGVGVAVATLLVQIFTWADGHDRDGALGPVAQNQGHDPGTDAQRVQGG